MGDQHAVSMPNNTLSTTPVPSAFLPPRTTIRFSSIAGRTDVHYGGIAVGDPSQGINYQLWTCFTDGNNVWLQAPNTPAYVLLPNVGAAWVGLAFDQNARVFVAYADVNGNASYYWYDTTIPGYRTSTLSGVIPRVFASLDDSRPALSESADILLAYVRTGNLYYRQQRDRYGVEYNLGTAPSILVQIGMAHADRFQFAFQNVQNDQVVPPGEYNLALGINEPS